MNGSMEGEAPEIHAAVSLPLNLFLYWKQNFSTPWNPSAKLSQQPGFIILEKFHHQFQEPPAVSEIYSHWFLTCRMYYGQEIIYEQWQAMLNTVAIMYGILQHKILKCVFHAHLFSCIELGMNAISSSIHWALLSAYLFSKYIRRIAPEPGTMLSWPPMSFQVQGIQATKLGIAINPKKKKKLVWMHKFVLHLTVTNLCEMLTSDY